MKKLTIILMAIAAFVAVAEDRSRLVLRDESVIIVRDYSVQPADKKFLVITVARPVTITITNNQVQTWTFEHARGTNDLTVKCGDNLGIERVSHAPGETIIVTHSRSGDWIHGSQKTSEIIPKPFILPQE